MRIPPALGVFVTRATSSMCALFVASMPVIGCGGHTPESQVPDQQDTSTNATQPQPRSQIDRSFPANSTFADLITKARDLDAAHADSSTDGCLLTRSAGTLRLTADLAFAVNPVPDAAAGLRDRVARSTAGVALLSRWGRAGAVDASLVLVALTSSSPRAGTAPVLAAFITREGVLVRTSEQEPPGSTRAPLAFAEAGQLLAIAGPRGNATIAITADADVPLTDVATVLRALGDPHAGNASVLGDVVLAVPLPNETRIPPTPASTTSTSDAFCPTGLPALAANDPEGDVPPSSVVAALAPLRESAQSCLRSATGRGAAGGRMSVAARIGPEGRVVATCITRSENDDPTLARCIVEATRAISFPRPSPTGFVDFELPLALLPDDSLTQRALCER